MREIDGWLVSEKSTKIIKCSEINIDLAKRIANESGPLILDSVRSLTPEVAKILSRHESGPISLDGLNNISNEVLFELSTYKGAIFLNGLEKITDHSAEILGKFSAKSLSLNNINSLSISAAKSLSRFSGYELHLTGISDLPPEIASAIVGNFCLYLGIKILSPKTARSLAQHPYGNQIHFPNVTNLLPETAKELGNSSFSEIYFSGITSIQNKTLNELINIKQKINLDSITTISDECALNICEIINYNENNDWLCGKNLKFPPIRQIDRVSEAIILLYIRLLRRSFDVRESRPHPDQEYIESLILNPTTAIIESLVACRIKERPSVSLKFATDITMEGAKILANMEYGIINLDSVREISDQKMVALSKFKGRLKLNSIKTISPLFINSILCHPRRSKSLGSCELKGVTEVSDSVLHILKKNKKELLGINLLGFKTKNACPRLIFSEHFSKFLIRKIRN